MFFSNLLARDALIGFFLSTSDFEEDKLQGLFPARWLLTTRGLLPARCEKGSCG